MQYITIFTVNYGRYIYMTVYSITIFPIYKNEKIEQQESMINWKKKQ